MVCASDTDASWARCSRHILLGGPRVKPGHRIQQSHKVLGGAGGGLDISAGKSDVSGNVGNKWKVGYSYMSLCVLAMNVASLS